MEAFEKEEQEFRSKLGLPSEEVTIEILALDKYLSLTLDKPGEIWEYETAINQHFYTHILSFQHKENTYYKVLITAYIEGSPSFVYYRLVTQSKELVELYRREFQVEVSEVEIIGKTKDSGVKSKLGDDSEGVDQAQLSMATELIEEIELKKSSLLAEMLTNRSVGDIELEEFPSYDEYLEQTLHAPDEVYEFEDETGDTLHTCIKSYQIGNVPFFYILLAMPYKSRSETGESALIPILGFPSVDKELYPKYAVGKRIDKNLKN